MQAQIKAMEEDPLNNLGNLRARTANEILKGFRHLQRHERELRVPIYAHHGTDDHLADVQAGNLPVQTLYHATFTSS